MNRTLRERLERNAARGVELANDLAWIDTLLGDADVPPPFALACPSIPRIIAGLKTGFDNEEEDAAIGQPYFQRMVRICWRLRPVSFWMLARSVAEGERFPFRDAMDQHLREETSIASRLALKSVYVKKLATAMQRVTRAGEAWRRLQDQILSWERSAHWFVTDFPAKQAFASATAEQDKAKPFHAGERFEDGLVVQLEETWADEDRGELRDGKLHVTASRPSGDHGEERLDVSLIGHDGVWRPTSVLLRAAHESSGGRTDMGSYQEIRRALGPRCLVVVASDPFPDLP